MTAGPSEKDTCRDSVVPRLRASGWDVAMVRTEVPVVAERSMSSRTASRTTADGRADYLLEPVPGVPVAVVEAKRLYAAPSQDLQQGTEYARRLDIPLVYSTNGTGLRERDLAAGTERDLDSFPTPAEMWARYVQVHGLDDGQVAALRQPPNRVLVDAEGNTREVRSYQLTAVHRVLRAVAGGERRVLLLMATGTGKTFTALQMVHRLLGWWRAVTPDRPHRVLYLADRDALVDHPLRKTFAPALAPDSTTRILRVERRSGGSSSPCSRCTPATASTRCLTEALSVPQLSPLGTVGEIVRWFGDAHDDRGAVDAMQRDLPPT